jgi:hypothetical protein
MVTVPMTPGETVGRALALRRLMTLALPRDGGAGEPIGVFPEGERGGVDGLRPALPGIGRFFALLGRHCVPVVPAALFEDEGGLVARFGAPLYVHAVRDGEASAQVMRRIAALLPERLRGAYR